MYQRVQTFLLSNKTAVMLAIVAVVAVSSAAWNWYHPQTRTVTQTQYQTVEKEKVVDRIKLVKVPGPKEIVTIEKQVIVEKLVLPPSIASDPNQVITGNADVPPSEGGTSVVSVLDTVTGETQIISKPKPLSLFGLPSEIEAGIRYGLSTATVQQGQLYGRWQFLRVGKLYLGAYADVSTKPEARAMLDVAFKF